jgi:hypothetical protein
MPCTVEPDSSWYCCNCGDGPMVVAAACTHCCNHHRCDDRCGAYITPPESPTCSNRPSSRKTNKDSRDPRVSRTVVIPTSWHASLFRDQSHDDHEDVTITTNDGSFEHASGALPDESFISLQAVIEQHTDTIVEHASLSFAGLASTPATKSCPDGGQVAPRTTKRPLQGKPDQKQSKDNRGRGRKKASDSGRDDQQSEDDDEDDKPDQPPFDGYDSDRHDQPGPKLACPFCKFNPHRYRHEQSCKEGWATASDLR